MTRRIAKTLQGAVARVALFLESVSVKWLAVVLALNSFAQLWRVYTAIDLDDSNNNNKGHGNRNTSGLADSSEWLVLGVVVISYLGLAIQLLLLPVFLIRIVLLAIHHRLQFPFSAKTVIEFTCFLPVSIFSTCSNLSGIIDITSAPLFADIALICWRIFSIPSLALAALVVPIYMLVSRCTSRIQRQQRSEQPSPQPMPWYLLLLPSIVASSTASDLTLIVETKVASEVLMLAFALWGVSVGPALIFTGSYIKQLVQASSTPASRTHARSSHFTLPLAPLAQLALGIMTLGIQSRRVWADSVGPSTAPLLLGEIAMAAGAILGIVLWGMSAAWFINSHALAIMKRWSTYQRNTTHPRPSLPLPQDLRNQTRINSWSYVLMKFWSIVAPKECGKLSMCVAAYPVASFALATAYVAIIWSSYSALVITQILLALLTLHMLFIFIRSAVDTTYYVYSFIRKQPVQQPTRQVVASVSRNSPLLDSISPENGYGTI